MAGLVQWFANIEGQVAAVESQASLQGLVDQSFGALAGLTSGIGTELTYLAGFGGLVSFSPANLGDVINFLDGFITDFLGPAYLPYAKYATQLTAITSNLATLTNLVNSTASANGWSVTIPTVIIPTIPTPSPPPTPAPGRTTFTPAITFATPGNLTVAYATQTGAYVTIGAATYFWVDVTFTPTYTTASGDFQITLGAAPTPSDNNVVAATLTQLSTAAWPGGTDTAVSAIYNGAWFIRGLKSGAVGTVFSVTQFPSGTPATVIFSGCFF